MIIHGAEDFAQITANFYLEAKRLKALYKRKIDLLIGFESEWIRPSSLKIIQDIQSSYDWDLFIGSIHHVHTIPIDFDRQMYEQAREKAGGTDLKLFEDYFDAQYEMLKAINPPIVGHFDLIRLLSDSRDIEMCSHATLWQKVHRNLDYVASYEGILEINTSGWRKGLKEPYPSATICKVSNPLC
jgi:histidinol-phosphatase (PHP family)